MVDRFDELKANKEKQPGIRCPKCGHRNVAQDMCLDSGIVKLGPNWLRCLECDTLFIRNEEDSVEVRDKEGREI